MGLARWAVCIVLALLSVGRSEDREALYNGIGLLKGQVFITNDQGRQPAAGMYLLFRRTDCRRCVIGVRANIDGRYEIFVANGAYRVFCDEPESREDMIPKRQPREVTVRRPPDQTEFNIELEVPHR
jgi:hypothetical protein